MSRNVVLSDVNYELRKAYYTALQGVISVNVYDSVIPKGSVDYDANSFKYVLLSTSTNVSDNDKSSHGWDNTLLLDVVTGYHQFPGKKENDDICAEIMPIIFPQSLNYLSVTGFTIIGTDIIGNEDLVEETETHIITRRLIRVRNLIRQQ
jgi:hypothetical protein